jgi:hypothetical protein
MGADTLQISMFVGNGSSVEARAATQGHPLFLQSMKRVATM